MRAAFHDQPSVDGIDEEQAPMVASTSSYEDLEVLRNRTFDEIAVGDRASIQRTLTAADIQLFAAMSGDINPQHIDPEFAKLAGFDKPILHGLCSYGIAGRAILEGICGNDPARFKSFSARLMNVVFAGETLITEGWELGDGSYVLQTRTPDGRVVLGNARAEARP